MKMLDRKKRKYNNDCRIFNEKRSINYFFIEINGKAVCLVCRETVFKRHYESKHQDKFAHLKGKQYF